MSSSDDREDKMVVDPADQPAIALGKGTRERVSMLEPPDGSVRTRLAHELARDPVEVLRMWPHSKTTVALYGDGLRVATATPARRRVEDKILLAHLALDLYHEVEQLPEAGHGASFLDPAVVLCTSKRCATQVDLLRGALIEACLLVQRIAMTSHPVAAMSDIEDRIHELLELIE